MTVDGRFDISGKRILLVGATGVLGRAHARSLADAGARLTIADLGSSDIVEFSQSMGEDCRSVAIDVGSERSVKEAVAATVSHWDGLDAVVSNAALTGEGLLAQGDAFAPFEDYPLDVWRKVIDVNLTGSFLVAREAGRAIKQSGGGSMVLVSSIYGVVAPDHRIYEDMPFRSFAAYSASKAGIVGLTRWLSTWWAESGIRVNCIAPGGVYNNHDPAFAQAYGQRVPMGRMAERDEVSATLIYLLSDAASYVTGQVFAVDGGMTAW